MKLRATLITMLACLTSAALAQDMSPPAELKAQEWHIGEWVGTMKWTMPGMDGEGPMTYKNEWDGQFMKTTSVSEMGGMKMTETAYTGWNAKTKKFDTWTFTNFAPTPRLEHGSYEGAKGVFLSEPWEVMGQTMESRATMTKKSDDEVSFVLEFKMGADWSKVGEGTFKKKKTEGIKQ